MNLTAVIALVLMVITFFLVCDWILHRQIISGGAADRYVMITGCDSGFGQRAVRRLDMAGCQVIATCLTTEGANALRDVCSSRLTIVQMDVTSDVSVQQAYCVVSELLQPDKGEICLLLYINVDVVISVFL